MAKANEKLKTTPIKATAPKQPENHPTGTPFIEAGKPAPPKKSETDPKKDQPAAVTKSPVPEKPVSVPPPKKN